MGSNYEKQVFAAREIFLKYDQRIMTERFPIKSDEKYLYLKFLGTDYRVCRENGEIEEQKEEGYVPCLDYQVVMALYDILCYPKGRPALSGEWRTLASLQVTHSSPSADKFTAPYGKLFSGKAGALADACKRLGGRRLDVPASADVSWEIPVFSFFPVAFSFLEGDEEFSPVITLLWDKNSLDFMHFETLYYVMNHLLERLKEVIRPIAIPGCYKEDKKHEK